MIQHLVLAKRLEFEKNHRSALIIRKKTSQEHVYTIMKTKHRRRAGGGFSSGRSR